MIKLILSQHLVLEVETRFPGRDPTESFRRLEHALEEVSHLHRRVLRTPLDLVMGPIFQGVLRDPPSFPDLVATLEAQLQGSFFRFGLGWGSIDTPLRGRVHHMDGPAFGFAHEALQTARKENAWGCARGFTPEERRVLDGLLQLMGAVRAQWKPKQRESISLFRSHPRLKDVARLRGVTPPTVSRSLEGALFRPMLAAESALSAALKLFTMPPPSSSAAEPLKD